MSREYKVTPKYRTNPLHKKDGGFRVSITYVDGRGTKIYENVQYPSGYIAKIKEGEDFLAGAIKEIIVTDQSKPHNTDEDLSWDPNGDNHGS